MADNKRYYWLKLDENFFEDDTIAWLEEQENGKDYVIFYLKLALKSLQDEGRLIRYVGETLIPYDVKALAKLTNTPIDTVAIAIKTFVEIGLIARLDTGEIYLNQINEMIGTETDVAKRVRKHRAKKRAIGQQETNLLQCNTGVTKCNTEIEIEKELDIDKEESKKYKYSPQQMKFAENLYDEILKNNPNHKKPNLESWANTFRLMQERDNRKGEDIEAVIKWCQQDDFWYKNILSADKLRKQFDRLHMQMQDNKRPKNKKASNNSFNKFPQREYSDKDYDDLEKKLLNRR